MTLAEANHALATKAALKVAQAVTHKNERQRCPRGIEEHGHVQNQMAETEPAAAKVAQLEHQLKAQAKTL